jgi:hypothetical protein
LLNAGITCFLLFRSGPAEFYGALGQQVEHQRLAVAHRGPVRAARAVNDPAGAVTVEPMRDVIDPITTVNSSGVIEAEAGR